MNGTASTLHRRKVLERSTTAAATGGSRSDFSVACSFASSNGLPRQRLAPVGQIAPWCVLSASPQGTGKVPECARGVSLMPPDPFAMLRSQVTRRTSRRRQPLRRHTAPWARCPGAGQNFGRPATHASVPSMEFDGCVFGVGRRRWRGAHAGRRWRGAYSPAALLHPRALSTAREKEADCSSRLVDSRSH